MSPLLESHIVSTGTEPTHAIIWLHGLGADGHDFAPLVPELVQADWPALRFVFPHAPVRAVTVNNGYRMRAWYDIANLDLANRADMAGVNESVTQLNALIEEQIRLGIEPRNIVLAGFSQGGAVCLSYLLRGAHPIRAAIALSTYLPDIGNAVQDAKAAGRATDTRIFMAHGTLDPVVQFSAGEQSAAALSGMGFDLQWRRYPMRHELCAQEIQDLRHWLGQILTS